MSKTPKPKHRAGVSIVKETSPAIPWSYWLWYNKLTGLCLSPGIKGHTRKSQGACRECWARLVKKIQTDERNASLR